MAKKALIIKQQRKPKFKVRAYTRCRRCGRPCAVFKKIGVRRIPLASGRCAEAASRKARRVGEGF